MLELLLRLVGFVVAGVAFGFGWSLGSAFGVGHTGKRPIIVLVVIGLLLLVLLLSRTALPFS